MAAKAGGEGRAFVLLAGNAEEIFATLILREPHGPIVIIGAVAPAGGDSINAPTTLSRNTQPKKSILRAKIDVIGLGADAIGGWEAIGQKGQVIFHAVAVGVKGLENLAFQRTQDQSSIGPPTQSRWHNVRRQRKTHAREAGRDFHWLVLVNGRKRERFGEAIDRDFRFVREHHAERALLIGSQEQTLSVCREGSASGFDQNNAAGKTIAKVEGAAVRCTAGLGRTLRIQQAQPYFGFDRDALQRQLL